MGGQKLSRLLHGDVVVEGAVVVLLRDLPSLLMLGRLAIGRRQQGDLGQAMRKDGNARGFDLQRLYFFARLFVRPAVHDRPAFDLDAHTFREQFGETLGILMPPLDAAPEAAAILVATLAIGNRVVEHHVETQQLPRGLLPLGKLRCSGAEPMLPSQKTG